MVWAVERTVPSVRARGGRAGKDGAARRWHTTQRLVAAALPFQWVSAAMFYLAMTSVPEHFIPFAPVHVPGRCARSSCSAADCASSKAILCPPEKVPPRTTRCGRA